MNDRFLFKVQQETKIAGGFKVLFTAERAVGTDEGWKDLISDILEILQDGHGVDRMTLLTGNDLNEIKRRIPSFPTERFKILGSGNYYYHVDSVNAAV